MRYFIYCRKSSEEANKQVLSLDSQENYLLEFAEKNGLEVVQVFRESKSAKDDGLRPVFLEMIEAIRRGEANGLLVWKIDRLSRNITEAGIISKLLEKGILQDIRTSDRRFTNAQDVIFMGFDFLFATKYSIDLSQNVKRGLDTKAQRGEFPSFAPIGYLNEKNNIVPDAIRAPFIHRLYELFATGQYSLHQMANMLYEEGFRTRQGRKVTKPSIYRILTNHAYYGCFMRNKTLFKGNYKPIISKSLFDQVQTVFKGKNRAKKQKHLFLYRGLMHCNVCGCLLTATIKKGRYIYYYCTNTKRKCDQHKLYMVEPQVNEMISGLLNGFTLDKSMVKLALDVYKQETGQQQEQRKQSKATLKQQLSAIETKINKLSHGYLNDQFTEKEYQELKKELQTEKTLIEHKIREFSLAPSQTRALNDLELVLNYSTTVKTLFENGDWEVKKDILNALLWNLTIENKEIASVQYKMPFAALQNLNKTTEIANWRRRRDSNSRWVSPRLLSKQVH